MVQSLVETHKKYAQQKPKHNQKKETTLNSMQHSILLLELGQVPKKFLLVHRELLPDYAKAQLALTAF